MMEELQSLMSQDIPEGRQSIKDSHTNLEKVAEYCEANYFQADNKTQALEESKRYTTQSLASVAYQINTLAFNLLHLLDLHTAHLSSVESQVNHIAQTVSIHKEKVARREIGVLTTNKNTIRQHKILAPANQERQIKYVRKPIDYSILDGVGHATRQQLQAANYSQTAPRPRRSSSSSVSGPGPAGPAPTQKPPTPPTQQMSQMSMSQMNVSGGTLRRVDYRTPPAIAPPQLPNTYATNYPMAVQTVRRNNSSCSTLPAAIHTSHLIGAHQPQGQQMTHYRQGMMVTGGHQLQTMESGLSMSSHLSSGVQNHHHPVEPANVQEALPAPPPAMMVHAAQPNSGLRSEPPPQQASISSAVHSAGNVSPPLPPPPEELSSPTPPPPPSSISSDPAKSRASSEPAWAPTSFLEKVVAVYDYQADKADELSFSENAIIYVIKKNDDGWYEGVMNGVQGLFPGNYVEPSV